VYWSLSFERQSNILWILFSMSYVQLSLCARCHLHYVWYKKKRRERSWRERDRRESEYFSNLVVVRNREERDKTCRAHVFFSLPTTAKKHAWVPIFNDFPIVPFHCIIKYKNNNIVHHKFGTVYAWLFWVNYTSLSS